MTRPTLADRVDDADGCATCDGTGEVHNCGEDSCPCADPTTQDMYPCPACGGTG